MGSLLLSFVFLFWGHHLLGLPQHKTPKKEPSSSLEGWKAIHVFTGGDHSPHMVDASTIPSDYYFAQNTYWFGQLRQDEIISQLLFEKRNGFFVDLAANDAIRISNTFALEQHYDWTGICIEPNSIYWSSLAYRQCTVVAGVAGDKRMEEIRFKFSSKGPQSGIIGEEFDNKKRVHNHPREEQRRYTVPLLEILERFQAPPVIDYLSLDVEGAEWFVLKNFDFGRFRFQSLSIERPNDHLRRLLEQNGYKMLRVLKENVGDTLWVHSTTHYNAAALSMDIPKYSERVKK